MSDLRIPPCKVALQSTCTSSAADLFIRQGRVFVNTWCKTHCDYVRTASPNLASVVLHVAKNPNRMLARFLLLPSAVIALLITFAGETAFGLPYTISGGSVSANSGAGLIIQTSLNLPATPFTFSLNNGESKSFNFFDIWTPETTVNPDDEIARAISATLSFSDPSRMRPLAA